MSHVKRYGDQQVGQRGQGVVEFALIIPILVLLFAGAVDLGNGFQTYITLTNAAREGARYGADTPLDSNGNTNTTGIRNRVLEELANNNVNTGNITVSVSFPTLSSPDTCPGPNNTPKPGCPIRVTVTYPLQTLLGNVLGFNTITLTTVVDMIIYSAS